MPMRLLHCWPLLLLVSVIAHSASFDCGKASTSNEKNICANPALSDLDEQYNTLYKAARRASSQNTQALTSLKSDAVSAFKSREKYCHDQLCLMSWYQKRIAALNPNTTPTTPALTIAELYQSLDLRTLKSSFGPRLKVDCKTFLADYFPSSSLRDVEENRVTMEYKEKIFVLEVRGENQFHYQDIITNATYRRDGVMNVTYVPNRNAWIGDYQGFELPERCLRVAIPWPNLNKSRMVTVPKYTEIKPAYKGFEDSGTAGEIALMSLRANQPGAGNAARSTTSPYFIDTPAVYDSINGKKLGVLLTALTYSGYEEDYASIQFLMFGEETELKPKVIRRGRYDASLLIYEERNQWVNLSPKREQGMWVNLASYPNWSSLYSARDDVIKKASKIKVRSAHNLRAKPNTGSEIIQVLGKGIDEDVLPLEIVGDWMKVHYVSPSPDPKAEGVDFVSLKSIGPGYKQLQGWIKFRNSPTQELVNIVYDASYPVVYDYTEFSAERF